MKIKSQTPLQADKKCECKGKGFKKVSKILYEACECLKIEQNNLHN